MNKIWAIVFTLVISPPITAHAADGGETLYKQRCIVCHKTSPDKAASIGPNLRGVVGRPAGSTEFRYSTAIAKSRLKWDSKTLDAYLTAPSKLVPGTRMVVSVPDAKQRAALISYLATLR